MLLIALGLGAWTAWSSRHARVNIEWTTASELNTVGFNLYRRDSLEGPEVRINPELIPASTDPLAGGNYHFVDRAARPGQTYTYELEDVESDGVTNRSWRTSVTVPRQALIEAGVAVLLVAGSLAGMLANRRKPIQVDG
jgi:hypothetical protein